MEIIKPIFDTIHDIDLTLDKQWDLRIDTDIRHISLDEWVRLDIDAAGSRDIQIEIHMYTEA